MSRAPAHGPFRATVDQQDNLREISVSDGTRELKRTVNGLEHGSWTNFFDEAADQFGTRHPVNRTTRTFPPHTDLVRPLLTEPVSDRILYGYGDPWVFNENGTYYLVVTSNDAPFSFPILRSDNLYDWRMVSAVFAPGEKPLWALDEPGKSDFWAPEIHKLGDRFVLCFSARARNKEMVIGLATGPSPEGPFSVAPTPLLTGNVIDAHLFVDDDGSVFLFWKSDNNDRWPRLLMELLRRHPKLINTIFPRTEDRRTVQLLLALWPWARDWEPIERFFVLQIMIEAARQDYSSLIARLSRFARSHSEYEKEVSALVEALHTPVHGQRLNSESLALEDEEFEVIRNDLEWEGHLIEGMCMTKQEGRYFLFYSGNDFSTPEYGVGYAVAPTPRGPFAKVRPCPILTSTEEWWGPGHPSIAPGLDGGPVLFIHAYSEGNAGYKVFRALLAAKLQFSGDEVSLVPWPEGN